MLFESSKFSLALYMYSSDFEHKIEESQGDKCTLIL